MTSYFAFKQIDDNDVVREFVFAVSDTETALEARRIIADPSHLKRHVKGTIVPSAAWYNPEWSFHLAPSSIGFFELSVEVCDANVSWVEDHLSEIGGSALPGNHWCPWSSQLDREVFPSRPDRRA